MQPIVGVSACLLGDLVRYDGKDQRSSFLQEQLSPYLHWRPFCPEVAAGMGVPRPTIGLYQGAESIELRVNPGQEDLIAVLAKARAELEPQHPEPQNPESQNPEPQKQATQEAEPQEIETQDLTPRLLQAADGFFASSADLCGYVFMQRSPSCAVESAPLLGGEANEQPMLVSGAFAAELKKRRPYLPCIQGGDLSDPAKLDLFLTAVFALQRLLQVISGGDFAQLLQFHSRYKYLLMAHSVPAYKSLGKLLARRCKDNQTLQMENYRDGFMLAINTAASRGGTVNALLHMMGYIKEDQSAEKRATLLSMMEAFRLGNMDLQQVIDSLHKAIERWGSDYIKAQYYWQPHPLSERLRAQF